MEKLDVISEGRSDDRDQRCLDMMKKMERRLKRRLTSRRIDDRTVICSTRDRLPYLEEQIAKNRMTIWQELK